MKCPHCGYSHREPVQDADNPNRIRYPEGKLGQFFVLQATLSREYGSEVRDLYGCPSCYKTFIN